MDKLVPYLPNSPIVVEGYSSAGAARSDTSSHASVQQPPASTLNRIFI